MDESGAASDGSVTTGSESPETTASDPSDRARSTTSDSAEAGPRERLESGRREPLASEGRAPAPSAAGPPRRAPPTDGDFGWRGWLLVGAMATCFLVIPAVLVAIASWPGVIESVGLPFRDAYLVLPTIPALVLAVVAVWAAVHARRD